MRRLSLPLLLLLTTACTGGDTVDDTAPDCASPGPSVVTVEVTDIVDVPKLLARLEYSVDSADPIGASCTEGLAPCTSFDVVLQTPEARLYIIDISMFPNDGAETGQVRITVDLSDDTPDSCSNVRTSYVQPITYAP